MVRKLLTIITLAGLGLLLIPTLAQAAPPPYPAPPVTGGTQAWDPGTVVDATVTAPTSLASTGAGFNVELLVIIAAVVLIAGLGLVLLGNRLRGAHKQG